MSSTVAAIVIILIVIVNAIRSARSAATTGIQQLRRVQAATARQQNVPSPGSAIPGNYEMNARESTLADSRFPQTPESAQPTDQRPSAKKLPSPTRPDRSAPQSIQSQAQMSDVAMAFAAQREASDQKFESTARETRNAAASGAQSIAGQPTVLTPTSGIALTRDALVQAVILSQAIGKSPFRRTRFVARKIIE
jgi:hypothetical protein